MWGCSLGGDQSTHPFTSRYFPQSLGAWCVLGSQGARGWEFMGEDAHLLGVSDLTCGMSMKGFGFWASGGYLLCHPRCTLEQGLPLCTSIPEPWAAVGKHPVQPSNTGILQLTPAHLNPVSSRGHRLTSFHKGKAVASAGMPFFSSSLKIFQVCPKILFCFSF